MVALTRFKMSDLSRQKHVETELGDDLTPQHTVEHAIEHFRGAHGIPENNLRWTAFSRGIRLDSKTRLAEIPAEDNQWTVLPEVSAGSGPLPTAA